MTTRGLTFSVIVPTYNASHLLRECINSLLAQEFAPERFEIIIVDDASTDDTPAVVEELQRAAKTHQIVYLRVNENSGPGNARNLGVEAARGQILGFLDQDVYVLTDWLGRAAAWFEDPHVGGVEGRTELPPGSQPTPFTHQTENTGHVVYRTCNILYRREVFEAVGLFDESFYDKRRRVHFREDTDFAFRVLDAGWEIRFAPDLRAFHPPLGASWRRPLRLAERHMFDPLLKKKHPRRYLRDVDVHWILGVRTSRLRKKIYTACLLSLTGLAVSLVAGASAAAAAFGALLACTYLGVVALHVRGRTISFRDGVLIAAIALFVPFVYWRAVARGVVRFRCLAIV